MNGCRCKEAKRQYKAGIMPKEIMDSILSKHKPQKPKVFIGWQILFYTIGLVGVGFFAFIISMVVVGLISFITFVYFV